MMQRNKEECLRMIENERDMEPSTGAHINMPAPAGCECVFCKLVRESSILNKEGRSNG